MELTGNGMVMTRTRREGSTAWWWIKNADNLPKTQSPTYIHRAIIKAAGGRWSRKRQQWYLIADELPASIQALLTMETPAPTPQVTSAPTVERRDVVVVSDGKYLSRTTIRELTQQGLATVQWKVGYHQRVEVAGLLFQSKGMSIYREVRLITAEDRRQHQLTGAQLQVENYLKWLAIVEKWQQRATILALPEPADDQPPVQILAPIDDPWS